MSTPRPNYSLDEVGRFTVENYNWAKPFSNFFPGIAGAWGIPMWVFYVSRGLGNLRDRNSLSPAVTVVAYILISTSLSLGTGFSTSLS